MHGLQVLQVQLLGIQYSILDLEASTDSNLFKLFGSSSHVFGPVVTMDSTLNSCWFLQVSGVNHHKTIFSHIIALDVQLMNFFYLKKK